MLQNLAWRYSRSAPEPFHPSPEDSEQITATAQQITSSTFEGYSDTDPPPYIAIDPAEAELPDPRLRALSAFWHSLSRHGDLPAAKHIDPTKLRLLLGNLNILEPAEDATDFIYRLYGSNIAEVAARDWTGWSVAAMCEKTGSPFSLFYRATYRAALTVRIAIYTEHCSPDSLGTSAWQRLILPFGDPDGAVRRLLVGNIPTTRQSLLENQIARRQRAIG